jgi:hypothetical protein
MKTKRSRFALLGVLALALSVTVGLAFGTVADAKKKKHKKSVNSITVATTGPTTVPPTPDADGVKTSLVSIPLNVGKKAKGKVVSGNSVAVTYSLTGTPGQPPPPPSGTPGSLYETDLAIQAPNGRTVDLDPPGFNDPNTTATGPTTETPDSPFSPCDVDGFPIPQPDVCSTDGQQDPEETLVPPAYAGTMGNNDLAFFTGVPARGTWTIKARNFGGGVGPSTVTSVSLTIGLSPAPSNKTPSNKTPSNKK